MKYQGRVGESWRAGEIRDDQEAHELDREKKPWRLWSREGSSSWQQLLLVSSSSSWSSSSWRLPPSSLSFFSSWASRIRSLRCRCGSWRYILQNFLWVRMKKRERERDKFYAWRMKREMCDYRMFFFISYAYIYKSIYITQIWCEYHICIYTRSK